MAIFRERIDGDDRYLQIYDNQRDYNENRNRTELLVQESLVGGLAKPWPPLASRLCSVDWTQPRTIGEGTVVRRHILHSRHHSQSTMGAPCPKLRSRIASKEASWGENLTVQGEFQYTQGYWEWAEDVLARCEYPLRKAKIYDAVYASLYIYESNPHVVRAFCEFWSPSTNTLVTSVGEVSISLWDLHRFGGLPILGKLFDEVVPSAHELNNIAEQIENDLPESCRHLLHAFHSIYQRNFNQVSISNWINYWHNVPLRYVTPSPSTTQKKTKRRTDIPSGILPRRGGKWEGDVEYHFDYLGIHGDLRKKTYLAAFISCWLCLYALPTRNAGQIRPGVFKMACYMASKIEVGLAIPVLSGIYRGINAIAESVTPDKPRVSLPFHYVHAWMAFYFGTYSTTTTEWKEWKGPPMVKFSGEGRAKSYSEAEAYKRIRKGCTNWSPNPLEQKRPLHFFDTGENLVPDMSFFLSIRSSFLPLRLDNSFRLEPYSPHRFSRQFGYCQDTPGGAPHIDIRRASLAKGLEYWRLCTDRETNQRAFFPLPENKFGITKDYGNWLEKLIKDLGLEDPPVSKSQKQKATRKKTKRFHNEHESDGNDDSDGVVNQEMSTHTSHENVNSQIENKKKNLVALKKKREDISTQIQQEMEALNLLEGRSSTSTNIDGLRDEEAAVREV